MGQGDSDTLPLLQPFQNKDSRGFPGTGPAIIKVNLDG